MKEKLNISFAILLITLFSSFAFTGCGTVDEPICGTCSGGTALRIIGADTTIIGTKSATFCGDDFSFATKNPVVTSTKDTITVSTYETCIGK